jgi:hypothetical protein
MDLINTGPSARRSALSIIGSMRVTVSAGVDKGRPFIIPSFLAPVLASQSIEFISHGPVEDWIALSGALATHLDRYQPLPDIMGRRLEK